MEAVAALWVCVGLLLLIPSICIAVVLCRKAALRSGR
jgi:hypothetical protein